MLFKDSESANSMINNTYLQIIIKSLLNQNNVFTNITVVNITQIKKCLIQAWKRQLFNFFAIHQFNSFNFSFSSTNEVWTIFRSLYLNLMNSMNCCIVKYFEDPFWFDGCYIKWGCPVRSFSFLLLVPNDHLVSCFVIIRWLN